MECKLYRFLRPSFTFFMKAFYRIQIINKENIPAVGRIILAGNHKHNFDGFAVLSCTKRTVRFLGKKELLDKHKIFFSSMGIIPVDRKKKNKQAIVEAEKVLENDGMIGIFPEGTHNKSENIILPFKIGAVKMAADTNTPIIPFAIINEYKLFRKSVKILFGKPYYIQKKDDLENENKILMSKVICLLKNEME